MTMQIGTDAAAAVPATLLGVRWAIKSSFSMYIEAMSDGDIAVFDGAKRLEDGSFFFPLVDETQYEGVTTRSFDGTVQFTGHRGMLAVTVGGLRLVDNGRTAQLSIADSLMSDGRLTMVEAGQRERDGQDLRFPTPILTEDGSDLFFENYPKGAEFEPFWLLSRVAD